MKHQLKCRTNFVAQSRRFADGEFEMHDARRQCASQRGALMQRENAEVLKAFNIAFNTTAHATLCGLVRTCLFSSSR